jgi:phosphomevalonate kinase
LIIKVKVPGKLILLGEYAVLEGADALVASIDRFVTANISASENDNFWISSNLFSDPIKFLIKDSGKIIPDGDQSDQLVSTMHFALSMIEQIYARLSGYKVEFKPFYLKIDTSQFYQETNKNKLGLGSSAALTVALIAAIVYFSNIEKKIISDNIDLFLFACDVHFKVQGNKGSGIDIAAGVFGGVHQYNIKSIAEGKKTQKIVSRSIPEDLFILPVWSGVSASTRNLLSQIEQYRGNSENDYQAMMSRLSVLAETGCMLYAEKKCSDFLDIVADYYKVLHDFSRKSQIAIISEVHKQIAEIVFANGGVYKPSGAGGGDIGLAFSDSASIIDRLKKELARHNFQTLSLGISSQGVMVSK